MTIDELLEPGNGIPSQQKYTVENLRKKYPEGQYEITEETEEREDEVSDEADYDKSVTKYKILKVTDLEGKPICTYEIATDSTCTITAERFKRDKGELGNGYRLNANGDVEYSGVLLAVITKYNDKGEVEYKKEELADDGIQCSSDYVMDSSHIVERIRPQADGNGVITPAEKEKRMKELEKVIEQIDSGNIVDILVDYGEDSPPQLFIDIYCGNLDFEKKHVYIKKLSNSFLQAAKDCNVDIRDIEPKLRAEIDKYNDGSYPDIRKLENYVLTIVSRIGNVDNNIVAPNGKLDKPFQQGQLGDCWFLATVKAISNSPKAKKELEKCIIPHKDGSVTVTLKGVGKSYTISKDELNINSGLSDGDGDVRALEIAMQKYFEQEYKGSFKTRGCSNIDGNMAYVALDILLDKGRWASDKGIVDSPAQTDYRQNESIKHHPTDKEINVIKNNKNHITVVSRFPDKSGDKVFAKNKNGEDVEIVSRHAYAVLKIEGNKVYLSNPHDTSEVITMTIEEFKNAFTNIFQVAY